MTGNILKIGIHTAALRVPLKQALHAAAQMKYDGVGIDARSQLRPSECTQTALREIRRRLQEERLRVSAISFPTRRGLADPQHAEARLAAIAATMRMAGQLGAHCVLTNPGTISQDEPADSDPLLEALQLIAKQAEHEGVALALRASTEPGERLARLLERFPAELVGVDFQPAGFILAGHSPSEELAALSRRVLHVEAGDAVRDLAAGGCLPTQLGRGGVDWPDLLAKLEEAQYRGWLTVELSQTREPLKEAGQAVSFLRSLD